jgi:hypothetical protein
MDEDGFRAEIKWIQEARAEIGESRGQLFLIPAPDDIGSPAYADRTDFVESLLTEGIDLEPFFAVESCSAESHWPELGAFLIPLAQMVVPTFGACVITWLKGHPGRQVVMTVGDVKVEARTAEEVQALLRAAAQYKEAGAKVSKDDQKGDQS